MTISTHESTCVPRPPPLFGVHQGKGPFNSGGGGKGKDSGKGYFAGKGAKGGGKGQKRPLSNFADSNARSEAKKQRYMHVSTSKHILSPLSAAIVQGWQTLSASSVVAKGTTVNTALRRQLLR